MVKLFGKPIRINKASQDKNSNDVGANLFIGNLDPEVDEKLLYDTFSAFGVIVNTPKIMRDPDTGNSKGFGFVSFDCFEASDAAIEAMNGQYLCNRQITVSYAYKKDTKGERHGTPAERLLAAQRRAKQAAQSRPHTLFATGPKQQPQHIPDGGQQSLGAPAPAASIPPAAPPGPPPVAPQQQPPAMPPMMPPPPNLPLSLPPWHQPPAGMPPAMPAPPPWAMPQPGKRDRCDYADFQTRLLLVCCAVVVHVAGIASLGHRCAAAVQARHLHQCLGCNQGQAYQAAGGQCGPRGPQGAVCCWAIVVCSVGTTSAIQWYHHLGINVPVGGPSASPAPLRDCTLYR
eukprot:GHRR01012905.1.p1 GENE.GHRR01012905.1~~GHRR01012905.1.p1  ORF type:complete len:344 (+),score=88.56 GHRR01012905.1:1136-2167(+)